MTYGRALQVLLSLMLAFGLAAAVTVAFAEGPPFDAPPVSISHTPDAAPQPPAGEPPA